MNNPQLSQAETSCLAQDRFRRIASKFPASTALVFGSARLSYHELDRRSDHLAQRLAARGCGPETLVGIHLGRSIEMVVALLAIWKTGAAYLPLDPRHPQERLAFLLADANVFLVMTSSGLEGKLPSSSPPKFLLDGEMKTAVEHPQKAPAVAFHPSHRAYVIYTSGSTGKPKGVELSHRGLSHLIAAQGPVFQAGPGSRVLQFSPLSFDASLFEIVMALMQGATLFLASQEDLMPGPGLLALLQNQRISHLTIPPSALAALPDGELPHLLTLACAGEACPASLVERFVHGRQFFNLYGPTESTVWTTGRRLHEGTGVGATEPTIGTAIPGLQVRVMDRNLRLVDQGEDGELCIAGVGLARGYLGRPALTAERFVPDPLTDEPGTRLYRSGDRVQSGQDGDLLFLGRMDRQVKIRGQRIELGEIESALRHHPNVADCVVLAWRDPSIDTPGEHRLVAWWTSKTPDHPASASSLRESLKERLPDVMVPVAYVALETFPLTAHGKVDHKALPAPDSARPDLEMDYETPQSATERTVAELFEELLGVSPVGRRDHFFELGGHSLLVTRLASGLHAELGVTVPLEHLFGDLTVVELATTLDRLATEDGLSAPPDIEPPRAVERQGPIPPSSAQERVWFLQNLHPKMVAYHASALVHFHGSLHVPILIAALDELIRRHEVLRTTWPEHHGAPVQRIHPPWKAELTLIDLSSLPAAAQQATLDRLLLEAMRQRFNMASLPLLRWRLVRLSTHEHRLLQVEHHLIHDGWSFNVMLGEILHLYRAFRRGEPSPLPEPLIQFADFALWQHRFAESAAAQRQLDFWRSTLRGAQPLELPLDHPRPARQTFNGRALRTRLDAVRADALRSFAHRHESSIFMVLLAAFFTLLHRITGQHDLSVGSGIANRRFPEVEGVLGMIINNLVLRADLDTFEDAQPTFLQWLEQVRHTTLAAYSHQDVPFDRVVEAVAPQRDASRNPLFQVVFGFHDSPLEDVQIEGLEVDLEPALSNHTAKFDLGLVSLLPREQLKGQKRADQAGAIDMLWEYNTALFTKTTVQRLNRGYRQLLDGLLENPQRRLFELPLLSSVERHQVLQEWNDTAHHPASPTSVVEMFDQRAQEHPESVAVCAGHRTVTYGELARRSEHLAAHLVAAGVGPEVPVGLALDRSVELFLAQIAVLTAGGAFVALDPSLPAERLSYMLDDCQTKLLITRGDLAPRYATAERQVLVLDEHTSLDALSNSGARGSTRGEGVHGETLAYVIYTSGSTGQPKGTLLSQAGLANLATSHHRDYFSNAEDRAAQIAGPGFDASIWEGWPYLSIGASLHVPAKEVGTDPTRVMEWLVRERITYAFLPTPVANAILEQKAPTGLALRGLATGGDRLHHRPAADFPCAVTNNYGPTEVTVVTTRSPIDPHGKGLPPIGRPLSNLQVYVTDRHLAAVPHGAVGELLIAGDGLARGYLSRPALTAQRFVPNPFAGFGDRLYKSGDRVRFLSDGEIDFLGRLDHQVQIRGFRIELGEIESVLGHHPAVLRTAVLVHEDLSTGAQRLVAYVEWRVGTQGNEAALREYLRGELPEAMVPSIFMELEALPLTTNGKIDRKALPVPTLETTGDADEERPRNPLEEMVAQAWADVLNHHDIGLEDNFFALGGHSLLATRVLAQLRETLAIDPPLGVFFEYPTVASLAARLGEMLQEGIEDEVPLVPRPTDAAPVLSFAQERLWLIDRLAPGNAAYNIARSLELRGDLKIKALENAFLEMVRRQEALRTIFPRDERGRARKKIIPASLPSELDSSEQGSFELEYLDLSWEPQIEEAVANMERSKARLAFDLTTGPLWQATLLRLAPQRHVLLITLHHIIADGASIQVLFRELEAFYNTFAQAEPITEPEIAAELPDLPVSSADVALWQRLRLTGQRLQSELNWWREELHGAPELLELPSDRPRPEEQGFRGGQEEITLPAELVTNLAKLGRDQQATPFMTRLAAFVALLARHSDQRDLVLGIPVAGRSRRELEGLIGFFVSSLPLRFRLGDDPQFGELLQRSRSTTLGTHLHQDLPLERLVEELAPRRNPAHTPIFQVMFALDPATRGPQLEGLEVTSRPIPREEARFDLELHVMDAGKATALHGQRAVLHYDRDLFDSTTIQRLLRQYQILLTAAVQQPSLRLDALPLLGPAQRHQVVVELADSQTDFGVNLTLPGIVESVIQRFPDRVAVEVGDQVLSYGELGRRAHRLAHHLRSCGVEAESPVGICLPPCIERVVAVVGVLAAGGTYLTLDPAWPVDRLALVLTDTGAPAVISHAELAPHFSAAPSQLIAIDQDWSTIARNPSTPPALHIHPEQLANIIYTSGSTGRPKGVAVTQRAVIRLLRNTDYIDLAAGERVGHAANLAFDAATFEIWAALLFGGQSVLVPREAILEPEELAHHIVRHRLSVLLLITAPFQHVIRQAPHALTPLKTLLFGGEACDPAVVRELTEGAPPQRLLHVYGPTESATLATWQKVDRIASDATTVPIGGALANTTALVLGRHGDPLPPGVVGQLYLGGEGLARGYFQLPGRTAEYFVPAPPGANPHHEPGARLYRTGDRVRRNARGEIEFLGRVDHQVKIRGFRIEPGEVEGLLAQHELVLQAAVTVPPDDSGALHLVAHIVPASNEDTVVAELEASLRRELPAHMMPSLILTHDILPLTPNGKVDRRILIEKAREGWRERPRQAAYVAPRTPQEEVLTNIFSEVLEVDRVGAYDDFFELGGHSLLATQVVSRIEGVFGIDLPLKSLFETPTPTDLAQQVSMATHTRQLPPLEPLHRPGGVPTPAPLSFAQERLWFLDQLLPGQAHYNVPMVWNLHGPLEIPRLAEALTALVQRHEALRTRFIARKGSPLQVVHPAPRKSPLQEMDLRHLPASLKRREVERLAAAEARRPFDLENGPLFRSTLLALGPEESVLLMSMHHIVCDGWTVGLMLRELGTLYRAGEGQAPEALLPAPTLQYVDFAHWQRQWLSDEVLEELLSWWRRDLQGLPTLELPTDRPRPRLQTFRGRRHVFHLDQPLVQGLRQLGKDRGATLFMTLLAGWSAWLGRLSGQDDLAVGSPIANRHHRDFEEIVGFFVNSLVLRTRLHGRPTFQDLIERVSHTAFDAYAHQDLPFEKLVDALQPERNLTHNPLFQVLFSLQNAPMPSSLSDEVSLAPKSQEVLSTHFDLELNAWPQADGVRCVLAYDRELFDSSTIERWSRSLQRFIEQAVAAPHSSIEDFTLLSVAERHQLCKEWNDLETGWPAERTLSELFLEQAALHPDAIALSSPRGVVTYRCLARRATAQARELQRLGVGPEVLVAVYAERSAEMVESLLAIVLAGGVYVPLDPSYPQDRLLYMLEDTQAAIVLLQEGLEDALPTERLPHLLRVSIPTLLSEGSVSPAPKTPASRPHNLAYVMYTSGSTGRPKGIGVPQRAIVRLVRDTNYIHFRPSERVAHASNTAFDAATFELWGPLLAGGPIEILSRDLTLEPAALATALTKSRIGILFLTPALFSQVVLQEPTAFASVQTLILGGEAPDLEKVREVLEGKPPRRLLNGYGPTESTTFTTFHEIRNVPPGVTSVPIGRPLSNTQVTLFDRRLRLTTLGALGELCIGGEGLARGYVGRPALTAQSFVPDPTGHHPGARLYKTGDLVRADSTGAVEFLGRRDHQVKIRGFRIEPGEVESVLATAPGVKAVAVLPRDDGRGLRLVGYVAGGEEGPTVDTLRDFLLARLPSYMVPAVFVLLDELPLNENGKVDRAALPEPSRQETAQDSYQAPRDAAEEALVAVWSDVLGLPQIGIHDNFFQLGGDSILSIQAVAQIKARGFLHSARQLFEYQSPAELAPHLQSAAGVVNAEQGLVTGNIPLIPIQHFFLDRPLSNPHHLQTIALFEVPPNLDAAALAGALKALLHHHDALRLRFNAQPDGWMQSCPPPSDAAPPFTVFELGSLPENLWSQALRRTAAELQDSLHLQHGPLVRLAWLRRGELPGRLMLLVHHLAVDGVSLPVIVEDLKTASSNLATAKAPSLPAKTTSFKAWAQALGDFAASPELAAERDYWLDPRRAALAPLPTDLPGGRRLNTRGSVEQLTVNVDRETTETLLKDVPRTLPGQPGMEAVLLTALALSLRTMSGSNSLLVDLMGHGRESLFDHIDLSRTVGWLTASYPALLDLGEGGLPSALQAVHEQLQEVPRNGIGYGLLRYMTPDTATRSALAALPRADVMFNYVGQTGGGAQEVAGLFRPVMENITIEHNLGVVRPWLLNAIATVRDGELRMMWQYSHNAYLRPTIEALADTFLETLKALADLSRPNSPERHLGVLSVKTR